VGDQQSSRVGRAPGLGRLLASTGVSLSGQGVVAAAAPLLAASLTSSPFGVASVTAASYAASLLIGLPAGAMVDRWPRRSTMVVADLARALTVAVLAVLVATGAVSIGLLIVAVFVIAAAGCFFDPAAQAAIPVLVGRDDRRTLERANGWLWGMDVFGRSLVGPPVGAALFVLLAWLPFGLNALTFVVSAVLLIGVTALTPRPPSSGETRVRADVAQGVRYLFEQRQLRGLAFGMSAYNFGYNLAYATLVLYVTRTLALRDTSFGLLLSALAVGGVAGGWLGPIVSRRLPALRTYAIALAVQGLAWASLFLSPHVVTTVIALVVVGVASTTVSVAGGTARQTLTPDRLLGRVTAGTRVIGIGSGALGALLGGAIADLGGLTTPFVVAGTFLGACAVAFGLASKPRVVQP
jgi:MFS family permease